jgi:methionine-rich copper-binding protein CopC
MPKPRSLPEGRRAWRPVWVGCCCALALLSIAVRAHAHARLTESLLSLESAVIKENAQQSILRLRFSGGLDPKGCSVEIIPEKGETRKLRLAFGPGPGDVLTTIPPLPAGRYSLRYRVLSTDGHTTEESLPLRVVGEK